jgi:methyl-accepting chemotaxis protein
MELDRLEELEKRKSSLRFLLTLFFIFFFVSIFAVFILTSVLQVNAVSRYVCSQLGMPTLERALAALDVDSFEALSKSLDPDDPYYETARKQLLEIKENSGCLYLYTMVQEADTVFRYVIDGSASPDDLKNFSPLGSSEDLAEWDEAVLTTIRTKTTQWGSIDQNERWGATISVYSPILKPNGEMIGLIGCDIDASGVISWIYTQVFWQLGIVVLFSLAGLLAYIVMIRKSNSIFSYLSER